MDHVDSSNKIERLEKATVLAFSNKSQRAILVPALVKREVFAALQQKGKSRKNAYLWMFTAGLFLLFKPHLAEIIKCHEIIVIDTEYTSHEANIKSMLLRHCWNAGFDLRPEMVSFDQIGIASSAHKLAYSTQQGKSKADCQVCIRDFLKLL
jgi:hypothetical protein